MQVALGLGAHVTAVEPRESAHQRAFELGADRVVTDISDLEGGGFDSILDFAGFGTTTAGAIRAVRAGGTVVVVGIGRTESTIPTATLVSNQIALRGSMGGSPADLRGYLGLVAAGKVQPVISEISFDEIGRGLERVASGEVVGRLVAVLPELGH